ncbi:MAG: FtsH protease activity modulator HflK [Pseudomonadota bacterium]
MPWNSPGNNNQDPWDRNSKNQGPPDLDEIFQKLSRKFGGIFGGKSGGSGGAGSGSGGSNIAGLGVIAIVVALIIWGASGIYTITDGEAGVILQFGKYKETTGPGLHWHMPYPIQELRRVDMAKVRDSNHRTTMLTKDENIVEIVIAAQYIINDAPNYLFNVRAQELTIKQAMESTIREVVGKSQVDFVLYEGLEVIGADTKTLMQDLLNRYESGIEITTLNLVKTQPPVEVQSAFDDVIKSREDLERFIQEAQAYANTIVPQARGEAARIIEEATGYKEAIVARAEGEAERFLALLAEYAKAPDVTRERLYLEAAQSVYDNSSKVMIDIKDGNNLMFLPLDKLMQHEEMPRGSINLGSTSSSSSTNQNLPRSTTRGRESR